MIFVLYGTLWNPVVPDNVGVHEGHMCQRFNKHLKILHILRLFSSHDSMVCVCVCVCVCVIVYDYETCMCMMLSITIARWLMDPMTSIHVDPLHQA
jgi:hypothetical protein